MNLLPIFLKLDRRPVLVVGAGSVAFEKIGVLLARGARLRVIAPRAIDDIRSLASKDRLEWLPRSFEPADVQGQTLVIAATNDSATNTAVHLAAAEHGILSNSVDDIPNCDFFFGSIVVRGTLQVAISTGGESPALAQLLRREIDAQLPAELGPWLARLGALRRQVLAFQPPGEQRKRLLHSLAQRDLCDSPACPSRQQALAATSSQESRRGAVSLVGAGPGDPDLLTIKALRRIQSADLILHDDLVPGAILDLASPHARVVNVGKRCGEKSISQPQIDELMIEQSRQGLAVVRLKSGDPLLFGRAAEEIKALTEAGISFEVVPGVTAAFAAAAAAGISLTDRASSSRIIFSTGHHAGPQGRLPDAAPEDATHVVYMPGRNLGPLAAQWIGQGLPADLPCVVVSHAAQPAQQILSTTLGALGREEPVPAPSILIAGWTAQAVVDLSVRTADLLSIPA